MTKQEALSIINCDDINEVKDAFEFEVFDLKKKLLMVVPPIKIMQSLIKRFERLNEVSVTLNLQTEQTQQKEINLGFNDLSIIDFLTQYDIELTKIKLNISNNHHPKAIIEQIIQMINIQKMLYFKVSDFGNFKVNLAEFEHVKLSEPIDTFKLQQEIINLSPNKNELSEYISKKKELYTYKCIIISKKQIDYNGFRREI